IFRDSSFGRRAGLGILAELLNKIFHVGPSRSSRKHFSDTHGQRLSFATIPEAAFQDQAIIVDKLLYSNIDFPTSFGLVIRVCFSLAVQISDSYMVVATGDLGMIFQAARLSLINLFAPETRSVFWKVLGLTLLLLVGLWLA